jgi:hypothetical protein
MKTRAERVTINKEFVSVDDFIHEYVTNVSTTGAFIRSKDPLPVGTLVNLKFTVIMDDLETIEGVGEVVRIGVRPSGMGVVFRELTAHSRRVLERLVAAPRSAEPVAPLRLEKRKKKAP